MHLLNSSVFIISIAFIYMLSRFQVGKESTLDIQNGVSLERVYSFCYLGDMLSSEGWAEAAVLARVKMAWQKFRDLAPMLCNKGISLRVKRRVYEACVRSCMIYGSET